MPKNIKIILIISIVFVAVFFVILSFQIPDPIEKPIEIDEKIDQFPGWKTYNDNGIALRYPPGFEIVGQGQIDFNFPEEKETGIDGILYTFRSGPFFSYFTFNPAVSSLEDYLRSYFANKIFYHGFRKKEEEIKTFGDANGIFYTLERNDHAGFIFNHGSSTYHFWTQQWREWRPSFTFPIDADIALFLEILSTIELTAPSMKISTQEIANQRIYQNEIYGFEFKCPIEWGSLALKSITQDNNGSKIYHFFESDELISDVYYHQPSNMIALIKEREEIESSLIQVMVQIYKDEKIETLYATPLRKKDPLSFPEIDEVNFSPDGKYVYFGIGVYTYDRNEFLNIDNGFSIVENYNVLFSPYKDVYWSQNNKVLAIKSDYSEFGGIGTHGVFVSDYENPEKLNKVFAQDPEEFMYSPSPRLRISDLYFVGDDKLFFSLHLHSEEWAWDPEENILETTKYEYTVKTKELKEIE